MEPKRPRVTLDDPDLKDRLRYQRRSSVYVKRPVKSYSHLISDIHSSNQVAYFAKPAVNQASQRQSHEVKFTEASRSKAVARTAVSSGSHRPEARNIVKKSALSRTKLAPVHFLKTLTWKPAVLYGLAILLLGIGGFVTFSGWRSNQQVAAQVKHLQTGATSASDASAGASNSDQSAVPSTKPVTKAVLAAYAVAPDLPRYIDIPSLSVYARVLQVGVTSTGAMATPNNVFDTAWYTGSSKPGEPGAVLIDGHVSSWTTNGVFYGIKNLKKNDMIKITRGDGKVFTYKVVRSRVFDHEKVDMQSAINPVESDKPGLNLITCDGDVIPGTNEFNQRIIVYATQV